MVHLPVDLPLTSQKDAGKDLRRKTYLSLKGPNVPGVLEFILSIYFEQGNSPIRGKNLTRDEAVNDN